MDFNAEIILEDVRVKLSPLSKQATKHLLQYSLNEPETWTYSLQQPNTKVALETYIQTALQAKKEEKAYPFIVTDKRDNSIAGSTRLYDINRYHKTCSLGYTWYGKAYRGTGLNTHCKYLLLKFIFETLHFERVEFRADYNNARSIKAMKNIGATVEGVLRNNCTAPNGRRDSIVLSILSNEWFEEVQPMLLKRLNTE
ncbi:GNAT family N-acetyltransferase [Croceibacter atlanticus]|uniref:GNAT family N-acetyltransferase n=1 Tax=Croceibacter atlanticus TaxID=313588 RepID=UPI001C5DA2BD|nr:GNAT family N-acetyltransferase [Croceibacter atlanticus]MBW4970227.1 GNAT family N-acetyltransferase [Croceibacter atlanticus]